MAAGNTYDEIATQTLSSASTTVTFSSIPSTYTDLILVSSVGSSDSAQVYSCRLNGDTGTNYSLTLLVGTGGGAASQRETSISKMNIGKGIGVNTPNASAVIISNFQNYSNTTTNKTVLSRVSEALGAYPGVSATVGLWRNTAAITSIELSLNNGIATFNAGSTFSLYGIKAA
jgi:hypothetical protein